MVHVLLKIEEPECTGRGGSEGNLGQIGFSPISRAQIQLLIISLFFLDKCNTSLFAHVFTFAICFFF